jgi:hypothetical protein
MTEKNNNFKILHFVKAKISINSDFRNSEIINFLWQFAPDELMQNFVLEKYIFFFK